MVLAQLRPLSQPISPRLAARVAGSEVGRLAREPRLWCKEWSSATTKLAL